MSSHVETEADVGKDDKKSVFDNNKRYNSQNITRVVSAAPYSSANITGKRAKNLFKRDKSMLNTQTAMEGEGSTCYDEETAYADATNAQDQIKSQVQFSDVELTYQGKGYQRPVTADHSGARRV